MYRTEMVGRDQYFLLRNQKCHKKAHTESSRESINYMLSYFREQKGRRKCVNSGFMCPRRAGFFSTALITEMFIISFMIYTWYTQRRALSHNRGTIFAIDLYFILHILRS